jgi:hypothetical protein
MNQEKLTFEVDLDLGVLVLLHDLPSDCGYVLASVRLAGYVKVLSFEVGEEGEELDEERIQVPGDFVLVGHVALLLACIAETFFQIRSKADTRIQFFLWFHKKYMEEKKKKLETVKTRYRSRRAGQCRASSASRTSRSPSA